MHGPRTAQEPSLGAGVTVNETVTATGLISVEGAVFDKFGVEESPWQQINLDVSGKGAASVTMLHDGDTFEVVDKITNPTVTAASTPVSITEAPPPPPMPTIEVQGPATAQEPSLGAGVTVNETVTATGLISVEGAVFDKFGVEESPWQQINLDVSGKGAASVTMLHDGDTFEVVDKITNPTVTAASTPVSITETPPPPPMPTIEVQGPATAQEPSLGAGVTVNETVTATGLISVEGAVFDKFGVEESPWQQINLDVSGKGAASVTMLHDGDTFEVVDKITNPTVTAASTPVSITEAPPPPPMPTIEVQGPATAQEPSLGAGVTVNETVTATGLISVEGAVFDKFGVEESPWQQINLDVSGKGAASVTMLHDGDTFEVVDKITNPTVTAASTPVSITEAPPPPPMPTIEVQGPATAQEPSLGAGVTVNETVTATGLISVEGAVFDKFGVEESPWQQINLDVSGKGAASVTMLHDGDTFEVVDKITNPTVTAASTPVSITEAPPPPPMPTIEVQGPATAQEPSLGAGVTVNETVTATGLISVEGAVFDKFGVEESPWQQINLDVSGKGAASVTMLHDGDTFEVVDKITNPTVTAASTPVSITEAPPPPPMPTIEVQGPATAQEPSLGAGVTVNETVTATGLISVEGAVFDKFGVEESPWQQINLDVSGKGAASVTMLHDGDTFEVVDKITNPTVTAASTPVSITEAPPPPPMPTIEVQGPATAQEPSLGAGVTVNETVTATGLISVEGAVFDKFGVEESPWQQINLDVSGKGAASVTMLHDGDTFEVVDKITNPTVTAASTPVSITEAPATFPDASSAQPIAANNLTVATAIAEPSVTLTSAAAYASGSSPDLATSMQPPDLPIAPGIGVPTSPSTSIDLPTQSSPEAPSRTSGLLLDLRECGPTKYTEPHGYGNSTSAPTGSLNHIEYGPAGRGLSAQMAELLLKHLATLSDASDVTGGHSQMHTGQYAFETLHQNLLSDIPGHPTSSNAEIHLQTHLHTDTFGLHSNLFDGGIHLHS